MVIIDKKIATFGYRQVCVVRNLFRYLKLVVLYYILLENFINTYFKFDQKILSKNIFLKKNGKIIMKIQKINCQKNEKKGYF
jgi:hypothetical protein